jgi:signal peptidase I, archaeal type
VGTVITVVLVVIAVFVLGSIVAGYPAPVSYVETDSMQPQLDPNDGFVGVPRPLAGDISQGDVVTYRAKQIGGGGLTTHRIIDRTDEGYITKGDNNGFNDTAAGEPPVKRAQIELVAVQNQGELIVIENIGEVTLAIQSFLGAVIAAIGLESIGATNPGVLVTVVGLVLVVGGEAYDAVTADNKRSISRSLADRDRIDSRLVLIGLLVVVSLPLLSVMMLPSGTTDMSILGTESPATDDPSQAAPGNFSKSNLSFENPQPVPMVLIVEPASDGLDIYNQTRFVGAGETASATVRVHAPAETGWAVRVRSEQYYLPLLPPSVIHGLHSIHPILALTAVLSVIWIPTGIIYWFTVGFGYIKLRDVN